jgi:hypothetical protein
MKLKALWFTAGTAILALSLYCEAGWATRAVGVITGAITATPSSGQIEVSNHVYHVKANSAAAKDLSTFHAGQIVDLIFDQPGPDAEVVAIAPHSGS